MPIRVLLVDDQPLLRQGFALILGAQADIEVVGEAADGAEGVELTRRLAPDVVLLDIQMPGVDGIEATRRITAELPASRVLVLTTFDLDEYAVAAIRAGASGFLLKNARPEELLAGVRAVATGDAVLAPSTTRRFLSGMGRALDTPSDAADLLAPLTTREREVFTQLVAGLSNNEIARALTLSDATVKTHVARILGKLRLRDRVQAVIFAYENGLI